MRWQTGRGFPVVCRTVLFALLLTGLTFSPQNYQAQTNSFSPGISSKLVSPEERAKNAYLAAQAKLEIKPEDTELAWQMARAAFDWAEFSKDNKQREEIALQGIAAARRGVISKTNSAPAHYYLAMNMGQLARTKSIGALKLVDEMEGEFKKALALDKNFDFAGPDRNLGLLYLEAPSTFSIGDRQKAKVHLSNAIKLSPSYPENRLNMIEAYLKWNDARSAQAELTQMEKIWGAARNEFSGDDWKSSWVDWEKRRGKAVERLRSILPKR